MREDFGVFGSVQMFPHELQRYVTLAAAALVWRRRFVRGDPHRGHRRRFELRDFMGGPSATILTK